MTDAGVRTSPILFVAVLGGIGTMVVELSAVRLIAPWFGTSATVWTNVIAAILLALALGYLGGARLAARARPARSLGYVMLLGAAFVLWLPAGARPVCELFLPRGTSLDEAVSLVNWGSLATTLILFLPPAVCLGCVGPLAVEMVHRRRGTHAGTAGGEVLCASTLGSLAGALATTHVLLPTLGLTRSFWIAGIALLLPGLVLLLTSRGSKVAGAAIVLAGLATGLVAHRLQPTIGSDATLLEWVESPYQRLRVVERGEGSERLRLLQVNEGLDSYQSVWRPEPGLLGEGYYYDAFALPAFWSRAQGTWRVLALGYGAGTVARVLSGAKPEELSYQFTGVEIDPAVTALGHAHFELPPEGPAHRLLSGWDARVALRGLDQTYELIVLDAYAQKVEIPPHLSSFEFFCEVKERLEDGGWLAINVGGFGFDDPVVEAMSQTVAAAFAAPVLALRVPSARNFVLFVRRDAEPFLPGEEQWRFDGEVARILLSPLELPGSWRVVSPDLVEEANVARDDRNPMELLQRRSLEEGLARLQGRL